MSTEQWLTIERLGSQGEGVATDSQGTLYIPGGLPSEKVLAEIYYRRGKQRAGRILERESSSSDRREPFCPVAHRCGGCSAQHMTPEAYRRWKHQLAQAQLPAEISPEFVFWGGQEQRRRVSLSYRYGKEGLKLGFFAALSHFLVPIERCPLLVPSLNEAITALQEFLPTIIQPRQEGFVHLTETLQGLDLSWSPHRFKGADLTTELWQAWGRFGQEFGCARITRAAKELIAQWQKPHVDLGGISVGFPAAAFLQPSVASQTAMQQQLLSGLKARTNLSQARIADLFCGLGTFSVPLFDTGAQVVSCDITGPSIAELAAIAPAQVQSLERNLFTEPLTAAECSGFDAIILDPPRAGAMAQCEQLSQSHVPTIAMVSCDLGTAARDIAVLRQGGYVLQEVVLFDQFPYTAHLEALCWFQKESSVTMV